MKPLRSFFWLLLLLATSAWRAEAQALEPRAGFPPARVPRAASAQEALLSDTTATSGWLLTDRGESSTRAVELSFAAREGRPRWVFPVVGAAVGGAAATYWTYRACQDEECIFPLGPPLIGLVAGALLGWSADLLSRPIQ